MIVSTSGKHLRPLDNMPFRELKRTWKNTVHEFVQTHATLGKKDFLQLIRGPLHQAHNPQYIEKAWKKTGFWPLDSSKVVPSTLTSEELEERTKSLYVITTIFREEKKSIKK